MKLIFHIGAGKTGSSSIQATLNRNRELLKTRGVWYLGMVLENAPVRRFDWQHRSATEQFLSLTDQEKTDFICEIIRDSVAQIAAAQCDTAIWSNEWFFAHGSAPILRALKQLETEGIEIALVAYVRRHDLWARSAYLQWGIKHKTYGGPLLAFDDWTRSRPPVFLPRLQPWRQAFGDQLNVRNYDAAGDVVGDFLRYAAIDPSGIQKIRANESPQAEELLLRALFNGRANDPVRPADFERLIRPRMIRFDRTPAAHLDALLPTPGQLDEIRARFTDDREGVDALLARSGQPPLGTDPLPARETRPDSDRLIATLAQLVIDQEIRLKRLEDLLAAQGGAETAAGGGAGAGPVTGAGIRAGQVRARPARLPAIDPKATFRPAIYIDSHILNDFIIDKYRSLQRALADKFDVYLALTDCPVDPGLTDPEWIYLTGDDIRPDPSIKRANDRLRNNIDLKLLAVHERLADRGYTHLLRIEYDVHWLLHPLPAFQALMSALRVADLLGTGLRPRTDGNQGWEWWRSLELPSLAAASPLPWAACLPILGVSEAMIQAMAVHYPQGAQGHHEVLMPTLAKALGLQVVDISAEPLRLVSHQASFTCAGPAVIRKRGGLRVQAGDLFIHPVKDPAALSEVRFLADETVSRKRPS